MGLSISIAILLLAGRASAAEGTLPTLVRTPGAKPAQFIGYPLRAADGVRVDADGQEHAIAKKPVDQQTFEDTGGEQSVGLGPGSSLRWHLGELPGRRFFLYFLCRTGHQQGYEYVAPEMTYVVDLNGRPVEIEPVSEVAAVRTHQSEAGWGHDMSWVRSTGMVTLKPGDAITVTCAEEYAFVTRCLLVGGEADALRRLIGRATRAQERVKDADELLERLTEVFESDALAEACHSSLRLLDTVRSDLDRLAEDIAAATGKIASGGRVDIAEIMAQASRVAADFESVEQRINSEVRKPLSDSVPGLKQRLPAPGGSAGVDGYHGRQAEYFAEVGRTYLTAAEAALAVGGGIGGLRRSATYVWRAQEFAGKAEAEGGLIGAEAPPAPQRPGEVEPVERSEIILNGEWEITTKGSPEAPDDGDWFNIRVPHGPWSETVGQFMALNRKWPSGRQWAWYRTRFPIPDDFRRGRLRLHFGAVFHLCEVYLNGRFCGRHIGGFDAFDVDITAAAKPGATNELLCFVHDTSVTALPKSERPGEPTGCSSGPNHYVISDLWGARFGGIWQDVSLVREPAVRVSDVFVMTSVRDRQITVKTWVTNGTTETVSVSLAQEVLDAGDTVLSLPPRKAVLKPGATRVIQASARWRDAKLWGIGGEWGDPTSLYWLRSRLKNGSHTEPVDTHLQRFGFREFRIVDGQFHLNGARLPLQGGGNWYLQEGKIAHGNRWFGLHMYRSERGMNVNIQRWHRHGDIAPEFFDLGDELGMLSEPEGPYWGVYGIPDIMGFTDWDDPVWVRNVTDHYRKWARKHRNHPSIVLWSIENETFCSTTRPEPMVDRFIAFGRALQEEDPTRPVTFHGIENGGYCTRRDDIEIVNLHYPSGDRMRGWKERWGGRPCINGEFQNYPVLFAMSGPNAEESAKAVDDMCEYIRSWTEFNEEIELPGALHFLPYMCGLFTTADRSLMGPWGDLLPDPASAPVTKEGWRKGSVGISAPIPIDWPSLSGPGIKCERLFTSSGNRSFINWFDPSRPSITPNRAYQAFADCWRKMPRLADRRAPEVIVMVTRDGRPAAGQPVEVRPIDPGLPIPRGAITDPQGTAWIVFREAGDYKILCGNATASFRADWLDTYAKPGYDDIPRVELRM